MKTGELGMIPLENEDISRSEKDHRIAIVDLDTLNSCQVLHLYPASWVKMNASRVGVFLTG